MEQLQPIKTLEAITEDISFVCEEQLAKISNLAVSSEDAKKYEVLRTETNNLIKDIENRVKKAQSEYLAPFDEAASKILEVLKPLKERNKEFSEEILEAKKEAFRKEVFEEYQYLGMTGDGVLPKFEDAYDPSWYGKPKKDWRIFLTQRINTLKEAEDKQTAYLIIDSSKGKIKMVENFLNQNGIVYQITKEN